MRLWHIDLIPYLPKSQLLAQWRELNSIFKKQDRHILINYIYDYDKEPLLIYTQAVMSEMGKRRYKIKSYENYSNYLGATLYIDGTEFKEHNHEYLTICYYNLKEKYLRGQKDFTDDVWKRLDEFYQAECVKQMLPDGVKWSKGVLKDEI